MHLRHHHTVLDTPRNTPGRKETLQHTETHLSSDRCYGVSQRSRHSPCRTPDDCVAARSKKKEAEVEHEREEEVECRVEGGKGGAGGGGKKKKKQEASA